MIPSIPDTLGSERSPPSVLPRVCVEPSKFRGKVNISWELLPCHLQNGADITSYTILYTPKSTGVATRFPSTNEDVECSQKFGDLYSCVVPNSLIPNDQAFSIQVAAQNNNGEAPFIDPISILSAPVSSRSKLHCLARMFIAHNHFQIQFAPVQMMVVLLGPPQYLCLPHQIQEVVLLVPP